MESGRGSGERSLGEVHDAGEEDITRNTGANDNYTGGLGLRLFPSSHLLSLARLRCLHSLRLLWPAITLPRPSSSRLFRYLPEGNTMSRTHLRMGRSEERVRCRMARARGRPSR